MNFGFSNMKVDYIWVCIVFCRLIYCLLWWDSFTATTWAVVGSTHGVNGALKVEKGSFTRKKI